MADRIERLLRYGILGVNQLATRALSALASRTRKLEIGLDGIASFAAAPLTDIAFPAVDFAAHDDPLPAILQDPCYRRTVDYFTRNASAARSLLSIDAQALLYIFARNLRPDDVIEIGVFKGKKDEEMPLYMRRERITREHESFTVIVDERPTRAGIDPYNKLIDRVADDNMIDVSEQ